MKRLNRLLITLAIALVATSARAIPTLQLDISGGTYFTPTQTIVAPANTFALYAYGLSTGPQAISLADKFFVSMAVVPSTTTPGSYGSFTVNGTTVNVTSDMSAGGPPLEASGLFDPGDLAAHGVFPTYFSEQAFYFSSGNQSAQYNTQDDAGAGPQTGTGMYYMQFDFNVSGLAPGLGIHFDLYNEQLIEKCKKVGGCTPVDLDINQFAPFSHDAEGAVAVVPEPESYAMLLAGLGLLGFTARRRKQKAA